ncbi:MAG: hypothetical protein M5U34_28170 [Chloroflexi bacterium]|nr:hypothetical protein [Chloroflexota bacterium]
MAEGNTELLERLNAAIAQMQAANEIERLAAMLIEAERERPLNPGEPRTGSAANEIVIGMVGRLTSLDPATPT